ncbi:MAG: hypothetical protein KKD99_05175 [Proteobacteria bacterium]|nr:hypothetical protein [Pseudomonadota bacterium]MBU4355042.1 hypothetical protein [Pseudomonadota bacterium]MBU4447960.1 hypothetical protein [Pseudomonadota bacterium]MCG2773930.1 hypothetical protein [Desulfobacterales bacterium]
MQSSALLKKAGNPGGENPIAKQSLAFRCVPKQELGNQMKQRKGEKDSGGFSSGGDGPPHLKPLAKPLLGCIKVLLTN